MYKDHSMGIIGGGDRTMPLPRNTLVYCPNNFISCGLTIKYLCI